MVISVLILLTYVLVANMVGGSATTKSVGDTQASTPLHPIFVAMLIIYSAASASFFEEIFFRGIPRLISMRISSVWIRNLGFLFVSSALFGLMHLPYGTGSAIASGYFGVLAGSILIWTNNLWYPLVGHFVTDLLVMWWAYARIGTLPV
jgi:membrane protease YdiL (CAAX protease family)